MARFRAAALAAVTVLFACSCGLWNVVRGNGTITTESRSVMGFTSVTVEGSGILRVHEGDFKVEVTADDNLQSWLTTEVSGTCLKIGVRDWATLWGTEPFVYEVTLPALSGVSLAGACDAALDPFAGSSFAANLAGAGNLTAQLAYDSVRITSAGSGSMDLSGSAAQAGIETSGVGNVRAEGFAARKATVGISGAGSVRVRASETLDVSIYGTGSLLYWGSPAVSQVIMGLGRIVKAGD